MENKVPAPIKPISEKYELSFRMFSFLTWF